MLMLGTHVRIVRLCEEDPTGEDVELLGMTGVVVNLTNLWSDGVGVQLDGIHYIPLAFHRNELEAISEED